MASPAESFAYDDDGNLTQDGTFNYTWDAENRLIEVVTRIEAGQNPSAYESGDKHVYFTYDYMGRRIRKRVETCNGSSWPQTSDELFVYDGWNIVMVINANASDVNATAAITRKYTWGLDLSGTIHGAGGIGGLLAAEETQGTETETDDRRYWFMYDANGNVGQVLDATNPSSITIAATYEYDPYGNIIGPDPDNDGDWQEHATAFALANPIRFSTKWFDDETHLGYWGYRYYSPRLGRWISKDPSEELGGLNLYSFAANRPSDTIDFLGMWGLDFHGDSTTRAATAAGFRQQRCIDVLVAWNLAIDQWTGSVFFTAPHFDLDSDRWVGDVPIAQGRGWLYQHKLDRGTQKLNASTGVWYSWFEPCVYDGLAHIGAALHHLQDGFSHSVARSGQSPFEHAPTLVCGAWGDAMGLVLPRCRRASGAAGPRHVNWGLSEWARPDDHTRLNPDGTDAAANAEAASLGVLQGVIAIPSVQACCR